MRARVAAIALLVAATTSAQEAVYVVRGDDAPPTREVAGHSQEVTVLAPGEYLVRVRADLTPIGVASTYEGTALTAPVPGVPRGFRLPASLRRELSVDLGAWEAATRVLEHAMTTVRYVPDDPGPQDARSVLARRTGRCSGLANAGAALLQSAGFEARTVSGLLVAGRTAVPHRWLECRLPDAGWVGCDPTLGLWVVTPSHVAFERTVEHVPGIERVAGGEIDLSPLPRRGLWPVRPNVGSEVVCRLRRPAGAGRVRLEGPWGETRTAVVTSEVRFTGLLAAPWTLELELDGAVVERLRLELEPGQIHTVLVGPEGADDAATGPAQRND